MDRVVIGFFLFNLVVSYALAFTSSSSRALRSIIVFAAGIILIYTQITLAGSAKNRFPFAALLMVHWYLFLRAISLLLIKPQSLIPVHTQADAHDHHKAKGSFGARVTGSNVLVLAQRLARSFGDLWSWRTFPQAIHNIPQFSATNKSYAPTRAAFVTYEALKFAVSWVIFFLADYSPPTPSEIEARFTPEREKTLSRIGDINVEEIVVRFFVLLAAGTGTWAAATMVRSAAAIISVGSGWSSPSSWPPLFGSVSEAYTLRQFWGVTWHQIFRMPLEDVSEFITSRVLLVPRRTMVSRFSKLMFAFLLSGIAHYLADIVRSAPARDSGSILFFALQPLGIVIEGAVQALFRRSSRQGPWAYWIGYLWVIVFLLWSGPGFVFPTVRSVRPGVDFNTPHSMF